MKKIPFRVQLLLLIVVLPLALALWGGWQFNRANSANILLADINLTMQEVEALQREAGSETVTMSFTDGTTGTADAYLQELKDIRATVESVTWWKRFIGIPLALAAVFFSLLAIGVAGMGFFSVKRAGEKALHSRDALLTGFQQSMKKMPWVIGGLGLSIALAAGCLLTFELLNFAFGGITEKVSLKLLFIGVAVVLSLLFFSWKLIYNIYSISKAVLQKYPLLLMGKNIDEHEAPLVWQMVRQVAEKIGAVMPDAIVIGLNECFFVTEYPVALTDGEAVPEGRILYLPLPYMMYMTRAETEAVIGHELGHFMGEDTEYSLKFAPIYNAAINNLFSIREAAQAGESDVGGLVSKPAMMFGLYYLNFFHRSVQHWSRIREFAADTVGAKAGGEESLASSLLRIGVLSPFIEQALQEHWAHGGKKADGVLPRIRQLIREHGLSEPTEHLEDKQVHPTDSHPPTSQRIEAVGVEVTPELLAKVKDPAESSLLRELELIDEKTLQCDENLRHTGDTVQVSSDSALKQAGQPAAKISTLLEDQFARVAQEVHDAETEELQALALEGCERQEVREQAWMSTLLYGFMGMVLLPLGLAMLFLGGDLGLKTQLIGLGLAVIGGISLGYAGLIIKRSRQPFLIFEKDGFRLAGASELIPWGVVEEYHVSTFSMPIETVISTTITCAEGYTVPAFKDPLRTRHKHKKNKIKISVHGIKKPFDEDSLNDELHLYLVAAGARRALQDKEV